jgi:hypothetical protein
MGWAIRRVSNNVRGEIQEIFCHASDLRLYSLVDLLYIYHNLLCLWNLR